MQVLWRLVLVWDQTEISINIIQTTKQKFILYSPKLFLLFGIEHKPSIQPFIAPWIFIGPKIQTRSSRGLFTASYNLAHNTGQIDNIKS